MPSGRVPHERGVTVSRTHPLGGQSSPGREKANEVDVLWVESDRPRCARTTQRVQVYKSWGHSAGMPWAMTGIMALAFDVQHSLADGPSRTVQMSKCMKHSDASRTFVRAARVFIESPRTSTPLGTHLRIDPHTLPSQAQNGF